MGDMFRSEEMVLCQFFIQTEASYNIVSELGEVGLVQFRDLNLDVNAFQRKYVNDVRRCQELERMLLFMEHELTQNDISVPDVSDLPKAPNPKDILPLETYIQKVQMEMQELKENATSLKADQLKIEEFKYVLQKSSTIFGSKIKIEDLVDSSNADGTIIADETCSARLNTVCGVIERKRLAAFEKMLWRVSRGNVFLRYLDIEEPIEDPASGEKHLKSVFTIFFQGDVLKSKVQKICEGFRTNIYTIPSNSEERQAALEQIKMKSKDIELVFNTTRDHQQRLMVTVSKELQNWFVMIRKMKAIYTVLNYCNVDVTKECLIGEGWVPQKDVPKVNSILLSASVDSNSSVPSFMNVIKAKEAPPTYNRTNKFTKGFQNLIDSYGVANYREANPALYTIITFPFLFAVMFGDIGHSVVVFLFALAMILGEKKFEQQKNHSEIASIFFGGRYIILLMGIFSFYTGLIYNDIFSKSMNIFGTSWFVGYNQSSALDNTTLIYELHPHTMLEERTYYFGMDPVWQLAKNKIVYLNSFKMKLSIIIGVIHMMFGVCVNTINHFYFRKYSNIIFDFIPQILLLLVLFFYMVIMIFMKYLKYTPHYGDDPESPISPSCAPSVLIYFINMLLFKENIKPGPEYCKIFMYEGQKYVQMGLVAVAFVCIPFMLLGKPLYIMLVERKRPKNHEDEAEEEEPMSEIFIHQIIHTIEYVLSTVSHTASYLRLWALSLAHSQLSEVLWGRLFHLSLSLNLEYIGGVAIYIYFAAWAFFTITILVLMEGLSAFLHTLRLHWVEFMSKFYTGVGYLFAPFDLNKMFTEEGEADMESKT